MHFFFSRGLSDVEIQQGFYSTSQSHVFFKSPVGYRFIEMWIKVLYQNYQLLLCAVYLVSHANLGSDLLSMPEVHCDKWVF